MGEGGGAAHARPSLFFVLLLLGVRVRVRALGLLVWFVVAR